MNDNIILWAVAFIVVPAVTLGLLAHFMGAGQVWVFFSALGGGLLGINALLEKP